MAVDPGLIGKEIAMMNRNLAVSKKTLAEYLDGAEPVFKTRGGNICTIEKSELQYLSEVCTEMEKFRLKLPIFISTDASGEGTAWKVEGVPESDVIARILGKRCLIDGKVRFFNPDFQKLRKILPNCTVTIFSL